MAIGSIAHVEVAQVSSRLLLSAKPAVYRFAFPCPSTMSNPWDQFWFKRVPPHALAITRMGVALYALLYTLLYAPHLKLLFSNEGLVLPRYADLYPQLQWLLTPPPLQVATLLFALVVVAELNMLWGQYTKLSIGLVTLLGLYFWQLQLHLFPTSYNRILLLVLLVLFFSGSDRTFSLDQKRRTGSFWDWEDVSILPQRLIALQISVTFLGVSLQKWWLPQWQGGEVLSYSFLSMWGTGLARCYARLPLNMEHYDFLVLMVKIFQPLAAVGVWIQRFRIISVLFLAWFIIMVSVMLSIWWFIYVIPACIVFWHPEEVRLLCKKYISKHISNTPTNLAK